VEEIRSIVGPASSAVRWLVLDAEAITNLDYTAAQKLRQLHQELSRSEVVFAVARAPSSLRADLDRHHLTEMFGARYIFDRLHQALAAFADSKSGGL
jgi:sulfate permease, SulP family